MTSKLSSRSYGPVEVRDLSEPSGKVMTGPTGLSPQIESHVSHNLLPESSQRLALGSMGKRHPTLMPVLSRKPSTSPRVTSGGSRSVQLVVSRKERESLVSRCSGLFSGLGGSTPPLPINRSSSTPVRNKTSYRRAKPLAGKKMGEPKESQT